MKTKNKLLLWVFVFALVLCSFSMSVLGADIIELKINQTKNLAVGDSKPLILTVTPSSADASAVTWSSSNESVAVVDQNGIVTGISSGLVTITATSNANSSVSASVDLLVRNRYIYDVNWSGSFTSANNNTTTNADIPLESNRIKKVWQAQVGNSPIVILDDYIYTYDGVNVNGGTNNDGTLYKVNKETGEIEAKLICNISGSYWYNYIIYGDGLLYVSGMDKVMAIDPDSFTVLWYADVPYAQYQTLQFVNNHVVVRGAVLNSTTGERVATLSGSYDYSSGVEKNGIYYIAANDGKLYAFDTDTWTEKDVISFRNSSDSAQAGVMYHKGRLYWSDRSEGNMCSIQIDEETGLFVDDSLIKTNCGIQSVCVPVAAGDRVYLAGEKNSAGVVGVFNAATLDLVYIAEGANGSIQSTPILREVSADGPSIMSFGGSEPQALADGTYLVVQDFGQSNGSERSQLYVLKDFPSSTSGNLTSLVKIQPSNYAYEQLACDNKDGSLYCTNDAGYLIKYQNSKVTAPSITKNILITEYTYDQGDTATVLSVVAESSDGGTISYQWQSRVDGGDWENLIGVTKSSYVPTTVDVGIRYYRCVISNTLNGQTVTVNSNEAKVTVNEAEIVDPEQPEEPVVPETPVLYGDVNNDGEVNAKDATVLRRHVAGWNGYELATINAAAADVNCDEVINAKDDTILVRYLAGWNGVTIGK